MLRVISRPEVQAKLRAHLFGETNPLKDPLVRAKAKAISASNGFVGLNLHKGGNGRGPTMAQAILAGLLDWPTEIVIPTGSPRREGVPTNYKLDIASMELMIAVEVDGHGHKTELWKDRDQRKAAFLSALGWKVIRFTNKEVLADPAGCVRKVFASTT